MILGEGLLTRRCVEVDWWRGKRRRETRAPGGRVRVPPGGRAGRLGGTQRSEAPGIRVWPLSASGKAGGEWIFFFFCWAMALGT